MKTKSKSKSKTSPPTVSMTASMSTDATVCARFTCVTHAPISRPMDEATSTSSMTVAVCDRKASAVGRSPPIQYTTGMKMHGMNRSRGMSASDDGRSKISQFIVRGLVRLTSLIKLMVRR
jgi:hypothetical protein